MALFGALGIGLYYYLQPTENAITGGAEIDVSIERGKMDPPIVRAQKGEALLLQVRADEDGTFRLENNDASGSLSTGRSVEIPFLSNYAGTFPVLFIPSSSPRERIRVGTIEVTEPVRGW